MNIAEHGFELPWTSSTSFDGPEKTPLKGHQTASRVSEESRLLGAQIILDD